MLYSSSKKHQTPYADAYRALPVKLQQAREAFMGRFRPIFQDADLTDQQWRVLRVLEAEDEIDGVALAKRAMLLTPSLSRILKDLSARNLIARQVSSEDGRRTLHSLTPAGRRLIDQIAPKLNPVFDQLKDRLSAQQIRTLNALLDDVIEGL